MSIRCIYIFILTGITYGTFGQSEGVLEEPENLNVRQFSRRVRRAEKPLLVCFSADTSSVCLKQKETFVSLSNQYYGYFEIVIIDMLKNPRISRYFGINRVPVTIFYIEAYPVWLRFGFLEKETIIKYVVPYTGPFPEKEKVSGRNIFQAGSSK